MNYYVWGTIEKHQDQADSQDQRNVQWPYCKHNVEYMHQSKLISQS